MKPDIWPEIKKAAGFKFASINNFRAEPEFLYPLLFSSGCVSNILFLTEHEPCYAKELQFLK